MDIESRAMILGVDLRRLERPDSSEHLFAKIILIDKSHDILKPLLYQWEGEDNLLSPFTLIDPSAFVMKGSILHRDEEKKLIYLTNHVTISYEHAIIFNSSYGTPDYGELTTAVRTLVEAIKIRSQIPQHLNLPQMEHLAFTQQKKVRPSLEKPKQALPLNVQNFLKKDQNRVVEQAIDNLLSHTRHTLYEVRL